MIERTVAWHANLFIVNAILNNSSFPERVIAGPGRQFRLMEIVRGRKLNSLY